MFISCMHIYGADATSYVAFPFRSSDQNRQIAVDNYAKSPAERYVATAFGDEIPNMRDDLIRRKDNGEGFFERHFNAWRNLTNWEVDPDNNEKELNNK